MLLNLAMMYSLISLLYCSKCQKSIRPEKIINKVRDKILHGTLSCACQLYPVLNGVVFYKQDKIQKKVLHFVEHEKELLSINKQIPFFLFSLRLGSVVTYQLVKICVTYLNLQNISLTKFYQLVLFLQLGNWDWISYLRKKQSHPSFFSSVISSILVKKNDYLLDVGCGAGHFLNIFENDSRNIRCIGVDHDLTSLYLASKYLSPSSSYIYLDLEDSLPFPPNAFQRIFSCDSFHLVNQKQALINELSRISKSGTIALNHLHNSRYFSNKHGFDEPSLTPRQYLALFTDAKVNPVLYSEVVVTEGRLQYVDTRTRLPTLPTLTLVAYTGHQLGKKGDLTLSNKPYAPNSL